jgi:nicotinate dehydrogenase subunit A
MTITTLSLRLNGTELAVSASEERTLLDILRNECNLRGTHFGCGQESCGACMVLINGEPAYACSTPASQVQGKAITTIEGAGGNAVGQALQHAFIQEGAAQCGYCTSGMLVSAMALLLANPTPSEAQIRSAMNGNVCRCGVYQRIVKAIQAASVALSTTEKTA